MKKLKFAPALLAAGAMLFGAFTSCDYTGDTTFEAAVAANTASSSSSGGSGSGSGSGSASTSATYTYLKGIKGGSSTEQQATDFFKGTKDGGLGVTCTNVELQLYHTSNGWTAIDVNGSDTGTKVKNNGDMMEGPAYISGALTTKSDAVAHVNTDVFGTNGYEMGRIKVSVTAGDKDISLAKVSGYFASGKAFTNGYIKVGDADYLALTEASKLTKSSGSQTGIIVTNSAVNKTIAAGSTKDVYILLGKVAESAPSAGATIEVAELVLAFTEASAPAIKVATITLASAGNATTVDAGSTLQFTATCKGANNTTPTDSSVTWTATDSSGAAITGVTISDAGLLSVASSVAADTKVYVKATAKDGSNVSSSAFEVTTKANVPVSAITVTTTAESVDANGTLTFTATCTGAGGATPSNTNVTWSAKLGTTSVDCITSAGVFTAPVHTDENKTYTITATAADGSGVTGTKDITVNKLAALTVDNSIPFTEKFEKANIYSDSALTIFTGIQTAGAEVKLPVGYYQFTKGVLVHSITAEKNKLVTKVVTIAGIASACRLALDKPANGEISVPLNGAATVKIGFNNNSGTRGLKIISSTATLSNASVTTDGTTASTNATATVSSTSQIDVACTASSSDVLIKFDVSAADTLTIKGDDTGSVYIYFVDVAATN